ncbi:hypothetical protein [Hyphobacterium sp.]|jgi:hypothetical protein|uniref:hypothetical protein n=1 Tax=Hyphobacterium sp. TaxID=2004662 RepID=UPI003BA989CC
MTDDPQEQDKKTGGNLLAEGLPVGLPLGIAVGAALGIALENIALGVAMGVGIGMSFSVAIGSARIAQENKKSENPDDEASGNGD